MSRFDLAKPGEFAAGVLGDIGALFGAFEAGKDPNKWDIVEGSYKGVVFHVFVSAPGYQAGLDEMSDKGGRRKVPLKFPYRDGQTTDDLGREPESFSVNVLFHGPKYFTGLQSFLSVLNEPTPGQLVHPIRGTSTVVPTEYDIAYKSDSRRAALIRVTFMEHNFSVLVKEEKPDKSVRGSIAAALDAFAKIENVILQVTGAVKFGQSFINSVKLGIENFRTGYAQTLSAINNKFNAENFFDFPALLPTNQGGNLAVDGTFASDNFQVASDAISELSSTTIEILANAQIEKQLNSNRLGLAATIAQMESGLNGEGSLEFYDSILDLKRSARLLQIAYQRGLAASQPRIVQFRVPRLMTIREVAFANGVSLDSVTDIEALNRELPSVNYIEKDTVVRVPIV